MGQGAEARLWLEGCRWAGMRDRIQKGAWRKGEEEGGKQAEGDLGWMYWVLFPFLPVDLGESQLHI